MDPFVQKLWRYRELLHGELPLPARLTIEWMLVSAIREHTDLKPDASLWDAPEMPELVTIANDVVARAVEVMGAQFGTIQLYVSAQDTLLVIAHRNFSPDFLNQFACFTPDGRTGCSRALASQRRVLIEDVSNDELFAPHAPAAQSAGFRALQSTPVNRRPGEVMGIVTTHFANRRTFSNDEFERLDDYMSGVSTELLRACA